MILTDSKVIAPLGSRERGTRKRAPANLGKEPPNIQRPEGFPGQQKRRKGAHGCSANWRPLGTLRDAHSSSRSRDVWYAPCNPPSPKPSDHLSQVKEKWWAGANPCVAPSLLGYRRALPCPSQGSPPKTPT